MLSTFTVLSDTWATQCCWEGKAAEDIQGKGLDTGDREAAGGRGISASVAELDMDTETGWLVSMLDREADH